MREEYSTAVQDTAEQESIEMKVIGGYIMERRIEKERRGEKTGEEKFQRIGHLL